MKLRRSIVKLDKVFSSLGDATRRRILERVREKPLTVMELASDFNMSLPAVSKHIKILNHAGLIKKVKKGRFNYCSYNYDTLKTAMQWISEQYDMWDKSFEKLEKLIKLKQQR